MNVRIELRDSETIKEALSRFNNLVRKYGPPGTGVKRPKWHKNQLQYYLKPSERRRRDRIRDAWETFCGECSRRRCMIVINRGAKRRKEHFGDLPIVQDYP